MGGRIRYFSEGTAFRLEHPIRTSRWLRRVAEAENQWIFQLNYIFCSDRYLLRLNREYLRHDTLTDIITFPYHQPGNPVEGDIFISIHRVRENSRRYGVPFTDELHRVMVHGLLHLLGYGDGTASEKRLMRDKETAYLSLR
jgi:rRNA maturation RNase YbeY